MLHAPVTGRAYRSLMSLALALSAVVAAVSLAAHLVSHALAAGALVRRGAVQEPDGGWPNVSLVRPLCGLETFTAETLEASFHLDYPAFELVFCVSDARDPVIPLVDAAMARHPGVAARLLVGEERASGNPKLDNMAKGFRAAEGETIVFADSNLLLTPDYLRRVVATFRSNTGVVSAPPIGTAPDGVWADVECALLNSYAARWQYAVAALGFGFAQGKTLAFRRDDLREGAFDAMAKEPAEDAAATKHARALGLSVSLVAPPFAQPIGRRQAREIWARHLRWARLRRATFPLLFAPEILSTALPPLALAVAASPVLGLGAAEAGLAFAALWYIPELALARFAGWPLSRRSLPALLGRDLLIPALWICAWTGRSFVWRGHRMNAGAAARAGAGTHART